MSGSSTRFLRLIRHVETRSSLFASIGRPSGAYSTFRSGLAAQDVKQAQMMCQQRWYHASLPTLKKGGNKGGNKVKGKGKKQRQQGVEDEEDDDGDDDDDMVSEAVVELPNPEDWNEKMLRRIERLKEEYEKIRGGSISSDMLNHLQVKAHGGAYVNILEVAQISMKGGTKINVSVFDPELASATASSIRSDMGLNPSVEGSSITVTVNKPSKEAREALVKGINQTTEKAKNDIRQVRKTALDKLKKLKKNASEDELKRMEKKVEAFTDKNLATAKKMFVDKQAAIMG
jgi:ribosome recycling factor